MDAIGLTFLNCFNQYLQALKKDGKPIFSERIKYTFSKTYGLEDGNVCCHNKLGEELKITGERVRQLNLKVFKRIGYLRSKGCKAILLLDDLLTNNKHIQLDNLTCSACYLKRFHAEHLDGYDYRTFLHLVALYFYRNCSILKDWKKALQDAAYDKRLMKRFERIYERVQWLSSAKFWTENEINDIEPARNYSPQERCKGIAGEFFSKKMKRKIFYESQLEKKFYFLLERVPQVWYYIEQCGPVFYHVNGKDHPYFPDVMVFLRDGRCFIVEIKPLSDMILYKVQKKFAALLGVCKEMGCGALLTDGWHDFSYILSCPSNLQFEKALDDYFSNNEVLLYGDLKKMRDQYKATTNELLVAAVRLNLLIKSGWLAIRKAHIPIYNCFEI